MEGRCIDGIEELLESQLFLSGAWARRDVFVQGGREDSHGEQTEQQQREDGVLDLGHLGGLPLVDGVQALQLVVRRDARVIK